MFLGFVGIHSFSLELLQTFEMAEDGFNSSTDNPAKTVGQHTTFLLPDWSFCSLQLCYGNVTMLPDFSDCFDKYNVIRSNRNKAKSMKIRPEL